MLSKDLILDRESTKQTSTTEQGCQICPGTTYQNGEKYTKLVQNIPNGHKNYQLAVKYRNQMAKKHLPLQEPPKLTQNEILV
jgi:hypothetical protein